MPASICFTLESTTALRQKWRLMRASYNEPRSTICSRKYIFNWRMSTPDTVCLLQLKPLGSQLQCTVKPDSKSKEKLSISIPTILLVTISYLTWSCLKSKLEKTTAQSKAEPAGDFPCLWSATGWAGRKEGNHPGSGSPHQPKTHEPPAPPQTRVAHPGTALGSRSNCKHMRLSERTKWQGQRILSNPQTLARTGWPCYSNGNIPVHRRTSSLPNGSQFPNLGKSRSHGKTSTLLNMVPFKWEVREG